MKETLFAFTEIERKTYTDQIYNRRAHAINYLKQFLEEKDPNEWLSTFSYLAEYISILFQFENLLEKVPLKADWNEESDCWLMDEKFGLSLVLHIRSLVTCHDELLAHNISFSSH
mgnify:CR=1 FL=1